MQQVRSGYEITAFVADELDFGGPRGVGSASYADEEPTGRVYGLFASLNDTWSL